MGQQVKEYESAPLLFDNTWREVYAERNEMKTKQAQVGKQITERPSHTQEPSESRERHSRFFIYFFT